MSSNDTNRAANSKAYRRHEVGKTAQGIDTQRADLANDASGSDFVRPKDDQPNTHHYSAGEVSNSESTQADQDDSADSVARLLKHLQQLMREQETHGQTVRQLQHQIQDGQLACGRMMREIVETQTALRLRTTHVQEDREKLVAEQNAEAQKRQEIMDCMARLGAMTGEAMKTD